MKRTYTQLKKENVHLHSEIRWLTPDNYQRIQHRTEELLNEQEAKRVKNLRDLEDLYDDIVREHEEDLIERGWGEPCEAKEVKPKSKLDKAKELLVAPLALLTKLKNKLKQNKNK